jgi:hypothetical protein
MDAYQQLPRQQQEIMWAAALLRCRKAQHHAPGR